ncbi:MAG: D-glycerate dehydrogenase [Candidatus Yanofskybacteria bacterium RIFCSPHIGHO2_02_FULL_39_10]|uniref:D-glycerate dehydrogenase n=1 Tax=Candidatus Yanofskybacteria bacterium RIFCSPHIGHO2_02_FULL_39_10 TaxID=1802674 RepID=A0A1F8FD01_9BACT|nr:MAG: D-glycerate dehydrogenase [Candidatus Yanofskybacteria bacterium RIFCSPHIGHO2_02_FULL_39_10]
MSKIFITRPIPEVGVGLLKAKGYEVVINEKAEGRAATKEELIEGAKGADAILSILTDKIDGEVMDVGTPTLRIIANYAVGFDNIDLEAAKKRNLMVTNTPGVLTNTVAEHTFALMLSIAHRISEADRFARAGRYKAWGPNLLLGTDMSGKTLGIVGLGRIGSRVASHAFKGFEMNILYNDPKPNPEFEKEFGAKFVEKLDDMLPHCDFVSIHVPLLDSTRHLMNEARFKIMKRTAYLVNTSRGPIIDEKALAKALREKIIKGAAIDVFEFEPDIVPELKDLDNVIITPHIASATEETRNKMASMAAENIIEALEGRVPPNLVK